MKTFKLIVMLLAVFVSFITFAACNSNDDDIEFIQTELSVNGKPFMTGSWGCYVNNIKTDICSTFAYGYSEYLDEKGHVVSEYYEYFVGMVSGFFTGDKSCNIEFNLFGYNTNGNRPSLNQFKKKNLDLATISSNYWDFLIATDEAGFSSRNSYKRGKIYIKDFGSEILTLSFDSYVLEDEQTSITLNGTISFKYTKERMDYPY